ncbi:MAG: alpha/beta hydrolase [Candidatus Helarchaeota archaeon]
MTKGKYLTFKANKNELEGVLYEPINNEELMVIVLHPHPEFGGSMYNNVVDGVCRILNSNGIGAFKFNVSGIGKSTGKYSGFDQAHEDVKLAVNYLKKDYNSIGFVGYSWGSYAGLKALITDNTIRFLCGIAPPVLLWDYNFLTTPTSKQPKCFIIGEYDNFCNKVRFLNIFDKIPIEKKAFKVIYTDHFYVGHEEEAGNFILEFIRTQL